MDLNASFQPGQIVDLKHGEFCLYAEVIQVVTERQICWVRPLLLLKFSGDLDQPNPAFYNLHHSPDLIWPIELFQPTLDTEVIPWLAQLNSDAAKITDDSSAHVQLRGLIDQIWQNFTDAFD
ncbi:MAG: hypothetical protein HC835_17510 [Oscillatoriales cyanobacterium RM2_1_1]|nr:hypothetical protein [Oscillatoriales cyanobacterium SM2_3_0]NJO47264.1 hypothetical protein [Oscillatoriales cyanobacterium RM2_1_1]